MLVEYLEHESYYSGCDFTTIQNVAINWCGRCDESNLRRLADALVEFPSCKRMILVMSHGEPPYEDDVEFLHISDNDQRRVCFYKGERLHWAGLKQALEEHWRKDSEEDLEEDLGADSGGSSEGELQLPPLEAVEVVPRRTASTSA
jgi:hypothetical protein